ncbi:MAG: MFS transporter [Luteitalea sp.]|nr:MFS transporter [Luteitalea sp.]
MEREPRTVSAAVSAEAEHAAPWYHGVTRYQWLVLVVASLGWMFDAFEGQIFVAAMTEAMPSLVPARTSSGQIGLYNNIALGAFLLGGALGGVLFGVLSDRIGRKRTLSLTIAFYSFFTCLSAISQEWWHLAAFRFLVALGVGGEWAVASALVAEVFPARARAHAGGIFHATSVLGTYLAVAAGVFLIGNPALYAWSRQVGSGWVGQYVDPETLPWRIGFAVGVVPALLIIWIRRSIREPETWQAARARAHSEPSQKMGALADLFRGELIRPSLVGVSLAGIGLATFWGTHIYGKNALRLVVEQQYVEAATTGVSAGGGPSATAQQSNGPAANAARSALTDHERQRLLERHATALKRWEMLGMFLVTTGGGLGLVAFGPISQRTGRRSAFFFYHLGAVASALLVFQGLDDVSTLVVALPVFGFLTLGMHAGYAIYFPELYPTRLRGTGTGFCFNAGRMLAAPVLLVVGWMQAGLGFSLTSISSWLSLLFLLGIVVLIFAPETRGRELRD